MKYKCKKCGNVSFCGIPVSPFQCVCGAMMDFAEHAAAPPQGGSAFLPPPAAAPITSHEGNKYLRVIRSAVELNGVCTETQVDVYSVIEAFGVTCPARQHAIKKILCAGLRGKGDEVADLVGAVAALNRAIELQRGRNEHAKTTA